ncbi:hypothetical protein SAMN06265379_10798 [Saccharicrinis carchari]|uniref:Uncharacterized protein n=1 Tax=Saccharicrinis carchari TaxID=1168039 RepID=A0A521E0W4_SACCC|nr:hypothetical protein SAMN06265379_10798 [Saccharicrinis carchari]
MGKITLKYKLCLQLLYTKIKTIGKADGDKRKKARKKSGLSLYYSHSIVAGGFELISYTTRLTPFTLLMISLDTLAKNSYGK